MSRFRKRLTYSNVVSTLALFLALCGGVAFAARVPRRSVGPAQLKANAVRTAKIKANAITTRKIKRNAVTNAKIRDDSIESAKIIDHSIGEADLEMAGLPFGRVVQRARGVGSAAVGEGPTVFPMSGTVFTQAPDEVDQFVGTLEVSFAETCKEPRSASAVLLIDSPDPSKPEREDYVLAGEASDSGTGAATHRIQLAPLAGASGARLDTGSANRHQLTLVVEGKCETGTGISANGGGVDVIGVR